MIELLVVLSFSAPDLALVEEAYSSSLNYEVVERGTIEREMAEAWAAPKMAGRDFLLMQPESGAPYYLRFVQSEAVEGYVPMQSFGWNAAELLVKDPDEIARRFRAEGSHFRIVGEPRPLSATSEIRAMQVVGPANEVLYLTRIPPGADRSSATTFVDRPFIVILAGPEMEDLRQFYSSMFGVSVSDPIMARITVLNKAMGLDIETTHPLAIARLTPEFAIELDEYPSKAIKRSIRDGELPPAQAIVSIQVDDIEAYSKHFLGGSITVNDHPYNGRRIAFIKGVAGEIIELIQSTD